MNRLAVVTKFDIGQDGTVSGIAWPFGAPDRYGDVIEPGAFKGIVGGTLPMLFNHDSDRVVGVWDSLAEKSDGLHVAGRLLHDAIPLAREVRAMLQAGAVKGLSIGFRPLSSEPRKNGGRTFKSVDLVEVSIVPVPAHANARVTSVKSPTPAKAVAAAFFKAAAAFR
jgi:HK97 family phage prohead protease